MTEPKKICARKDCNRPVKGRGLCAPHYSQWRRAEKKARWWRDYGEGKSF